MQAELAGKAAELAGAQEQHAASDADWESRMKDAVSSAEQWKEFAEKLGAEKKSLQSTLASTDQALKVRPLQAALSAARWSWPLWKGLNCTLLHPLPNYLQK